MFVVSTVTLFPSVTITLRFHMDVTLQAPDFEHNQVIILKYEIKRKQRHLYSYFNLILIDNKIVYFGHL